MKGMASALLPQNRATKTFTERLAEKRLQQLENGEDAEVTKRTSAKSEQEIKDATEKQTGKTEKQAQKAEADLERAREDVVHWAIGHRPQEPELKDDSFKFQDILFARLTSPVVAGSTNANSASPRTKAPPVSSLNWANASMESNQSRLGSLNSTMSAVTSPVKQGGSALQQQAVKVPTEHSLPTVAPLSKASLHLIKGLGTCIGKVDRCCLSPPPMNSYAMQLSARIDRMMNQGAEEEAEPPQKA